MHAHFRALFIYFLISISGYAQFSISNYNSKSGFPHDLSYRLTEDSLGYLYVATDNGLARYNGSEFVLYKDPNLKSKFVIDVVSINSKEMALATWGSGLHLLNSKRYKSIPFKSSYLTDKYARVLPLDNHMITFDDKIELSFFYKKKEGVYEAYHTYLGIKNNKYELFEKNNKGIYLGIDGFDKRVFVFSYPNRSTVKGLIEILANRSISFPFPFLNPYVIWSIQKLGQYYVALTDIGLIYFNEKGILSIEKQVFLDKKILKYSENNYYKAFELEDIKTKLHEVRVITKTNNSSFTLSSEQLQDALISQIYLSQFNSVIWISTYGNGLYKLVPQSNIFDVHLLKSKNCIDFKSIKGYNLFLTANELLILDSSNQWLKSVAIDYSEKFSEEKEEALMIGRYSFSKAFSSKFRDLNIKYKTINRFKHFGSFKATLGGNGCKIIRVKSNDTLELNLKFFSSDIKHLKIENIEKFGNAICLATNQGVFAFDTLQFSPLRLGKLGYCKENTIEVAFRNNKLWIATRNQILRYSLKNELDTLNLPEYFEDNINDMLLSSNGDIWLSSQKGFIVFKNNQFYQLNYKHGYPSSFTTKISEDKNGNIYLLGSNGVSIIKPNQNLIHDAPQLLVSSPSFNTLDSIVVFESGKSLEFKIDHLNYYAFDLVTEYQFNNQAWQVLKDPSLQFLNLKDGAYSVQFRSRFFNSNFSYSKKYAFEIKHIWYLRPLFLFVWSLILLSVLSYIIFKRLKRLKKQNTFLENTISENKLLQNKVEEMRQNVAQDFHDELGNKMAGISMLSEKLLNDQQKHIKLNIDLLKRINRDSKELYSGIRDFIWAIDSKNDGLQELIFTLTDFAEDLFQYSEISFTVSNYLENKPISLPLQWNRQLLLLFKEVMTNAFKHSIAKQVELIFNIKEDYLIVQFKDDGIGFDIEKIKRGNGLNNIYKRAQRINGIITIESNNGTLLSFRAKLYDEKNLIQ